MQSKLSISSIEQFYYKDCYRCRIVEYVIRKLHNQKNWIQPVYDDYNVQIPKANVIFASSSSRDGETGGELAITNSEIRLAQN